MRQGQQRLRPGGLPVAAFGEAGGDRGAQGLPLLHARAHQRIHVVGVDHAGGLQVEHLVADGDADAEGFAAARGAEAAERQVLDREVGAGFVGRGDPAAQLRVMGGVQCGHGCLSSKCSKGS
jgi:hypothetical protein